MSVRVAYIDRATARVFSVMSGPDLAGFDQGDDQTLAVLSNYEGGLPAYWDGVEVRPVPPKPGPGYVWEWFPVLAWIMSPVASDAALYERRDGALASVDAAAGRARLRYITSVPGQAETYTRKEQQAREWSAEGFAGAPPSFIAAEAAALERDAQAVAQEIIDLADYWGDVKGPQIEATRRKWKVRLAAAESIDAINALQAEATDDLAGL